ncbi:tRNA(m5U54)methyltransferase [Scheffersomyces amazonensis]|uniref:tRNA(m5U54)methyltransferase n=1 Tax=Scheffersomyces amazonensis TaxID=1078765 RepID=UPI00315CC182
MTDKKRPISPVNGEVEHEIIKKPNNGNGNHKNNKKIIKRKYKAKDVDPTAPLGVLQFEIDEILSNHQLTREDITNNMSGILNDETIQKIYHRIVSDVTIESLSSNGDGLALIPHPDPTKKFQIVIVPFGLPGDKVEIRVFKSHPLYAESDLLNIIQASEYRDDSLINCKYFGKCSGCQYQNVNYDQQLIFKRKTIENAYKFLAPLLSATKGALPSVRSTEPSPLQYKYRTKLTPHFNIPFKKVVEERPNLGFGSKGRPTWRKDVDIKDGSILDIEECVIGTPIINQGMTNERARFSQEFKKYKKGATILLREDTKVIDKDEEIILAPGSGSTDVNGEISHLQSQLPEKQLVKTCVTASRQIVKEYVDGYTFEFSAGEFFQNNNSILPRVIDYVRSNLSIDENDAKDSNYLVDAYCGSGLFSITCSQNVSKVIGVEVSADSVKFAERNAASNKIENAKFIVGKAEEIFKSIDTPADRTSVILDPPRKGCDDVFLNQLSDYNPAKIVYISCNVHSQARDVDWFINKTDNGNKYYVESIKGFDFFPQTHHVESVAVLALKKQD